MDVLINIGLGLLYCLLNSFLYISAGELVNIDISDNFFSSFLYISTDVLVNIVVVWFVCFFLIPLPDSRTRVGSRYRSRSG